METIKGRVLALAARRPRLARQLLAVAFVATLALAIVAGAKAQVAEAIAAVQGEPNPDVWALKIVCLLSVLVNGYLGRLLLKWPNREYVDRVERENDRLREDQKEAAAQARELESEVRLLQREALLAGRALNGGSA